MGPPVNQSGASRSLFQQQRSIHFCHFSSWGLQQSMSLKDSLEPVLVRTARTILQLGSFLNCIPFDVVNKDVISSPVRIKVVPRTKCVLIHLGFWLYFVAYWRAFIVYALANGFDLNSCIHLTFASVFSMVFFFSLIITLNPRTMFEAQNRIEEMQGYFNRRWARDSVLICTLLPYFYFSYDFGATLLPVLVPCAVKIFLTG